MIGEASFTIGEVYFVPELKNNLLSVGQLLERGLAVLFQGGVCRVFHPDKGTIAECAVGTNRLFLVLAEPPAHSEDKKHAEEEHCLQTNSTNLPKLWHERYGHLSQKGLQMLQAKEMVHGLPKLLPLTDVCVDCLNGKQTRVPIPKQSTWRSSQPLELVYSDICGPISPMSHSGKQYFLSFIDDFSRKGWVYLLAEKSEAFERFKAFKLIAEKEVGVALRCLRTDRGGVRETRDLGEIENSQRETQGETREIEIIQRETREAESSRAGRTRRPPGWLSDYVSGNRISDVDDAVHMVQDMGSEDPITFAEAVRDEKWRKAMDSEIASIEKNETI
ncbi:hypothetical protein V2J09_013962 [Rumex salicifolius]